MSCNSSLLSLLDLTAAIAPSTASSTSRGGVGCRFARLGTLLSIALLGVGIWVGFGCEFFVDGFRDVGEVATKVVNCGVVAVSGEGTEDCGCVPSWAPGGAGQQCSLFG